MLRILLGLLLVANLGLWLLPGPPAPAATVSAASPALVGRPPPPAPSRSEAYIRARCRALQATPEESRWQRIGWCQDVRQGLRLARRHQRPMLLWSVDGGGDTGRC